MMTLLGDAGYHTHGIGKFHFRPQGRHHGFHALEWPEEIPDYREEDHYVRLYVSYLRQKLEPDPSHPKYILTESGLGYRFVDYRRQTSLPTVVAQPRDAP